MTSGPSVGPAEAGGARDSLFGVTLAYLLFPVVIFFLAWLRPWLGVPLAGFTVAAVANVWRRARANRALVSRAQVVFAAVFALFWAVAVGIGGLRPKSVDYQKHDLMLHDLVVNEWPVVYREAPGTPVLTYYVAYYLPAGLAAKTAGLKYAELLSLAWAWLGIALAFVWVQRLGAPRGTLILILVLLIDGFCWLPGLLRVFHQLGWPALEPPGGMTNGGLTTIRFWEFAGPPTRLLFGSELDNLRWVPQHVLASWLGTACVLRTLLERRSPRGAVLAHSAVVLWSPFVAVGLVPFTAVALLRWRSKALAWPNLVGLLLAVPTGLYFLGHRPDAYFGVLFWTFSTVGDWIKYVAFLVLAVGILAAAAWFVHRRYRVPRDRVWKVLVLAAVVAVAATVIHLGRFNDWAMRTSMPAMFVLRFGLAVTAVELWTTRSRLVHRLALAVLLLLSAERPLKQWVMIPAGRAGGQVAASSPAEPTGGVKSVTDLPRTPEWDLPGQYLGSPTSLFARRIMARPGTGEAGSSAGGS